MNFCKYCGEAIEDITSTCPKCNASLIESDEDVAVAYNETTQTGITLTPSKESEFKKRIKQVTPFIQKYRKPIMTVLAVLSLIFIVVAITTMTSKDYQKCCENYSEYIDNYEENLAISNSFGGYGILGDGYKTVANGWKNLADDELSELWGMRVKAIIFTIMGIACGFSAFKVYKNKED